MNNHDFEDKLNAPVKNFIRLRIEKGDPDTLLSSRYGGNPMLPTDFEWPHYEGTTWDDITANRPLAFLGQIDLSETAPLNEDKLLPDHGILAIFYDMVTQKWGYDPADRGCVRVYWFENTDELAETVPPENIVDMNDEPLAIPMFRAKFELSNVTAEEEDPSHIHKLLGNPDVIQNDIFSKCELVSRGYYLGDGEYRKKMSDEEYEDALAHSEDWTLLWQIGTIGGYPDFELMWGDMGCLYLCIRKDDLAARNFDNVWLVLQCG